VTYLVFFGFDGSRINGTVCSHWGQVFVVA